ncbi:MAG: fumarylacetoacetate hydrolase family protein [Marinobacter sp.]|nr:fumarylacetoacetate hydrolase family protein [Marinobacter sp.]
MTGYAHHWADGSDIGLPLGKIVCIGRNYAEHAAELDNPVPDAPLLFIKPATAAVDMRRPLVIPHDRGLVHFETELAVLIGKQLHNASEVDARAAVLGYGLALDLTLRDVQAELKAQGHPWERAKAFDGACPLSPFVTGSALAGRSALHFALTVDGEARQRGDTAEMIHPLFKLIAHMSEHFTLVPGDVVLTGTPKGVGPLVAGQALVLTLEDALRVETSVQ